MKGCKIGDEVVMDDGTIIEVRRKTYSTNPKDITVAIKRDAPIGKVIVIKKERKDEQ